MACHSMRAASRRTRLLQKRNGKIHGSLISLVTLSQQTCRTYISLVQVYITYFFVRASVMLFVLRLLPSYKVWQQRAVLATFAINFLATLYTCIAVGISCIPFQANWEDMPEARCFSKGVLVLTNQINSSKTYLALCSCFNECRSIANTNQRLRARVTLPQL